MLPDFIGIGPPKTGTTWIFRNLQSHPDVRLPTIKETHFWGRDQDKGQMLEEYASFFSEIPPDVVTGEISTDYFSNPIVAKRLAYYLPDVKLFTILRNPVDQVQSHFWHLQRQQFHQWTREGAPETLKDGLENERIRNMLIEPALYSKQLVRWLRYFSKDKLLILFFDDMKDNPNIFLSSIFNHLGVGSDFKPSKLEPKGSAVRGGTSPRSPAHEHVRAFLYEKLVRKIYHPLKKRIGVHRAAHLKEILRVRESMDWLFRKKGYPEMNSTTKRKLENEFHDDVRSLEELADRDLSHWIARRD